MGDISPPTAADYAYSAAHDAKRENQRLEARVQTLEQQVNHLQEAIRRLEARLHG